MWHYAWVENVDIVLLWGIIEHSRESCHTLQRQFSRNRAAKFLYGQLKFMVIATVAALQQGCKRTNKPWVVKPQANWLFSPITARRCCGCGTPVRRQGGSLMLMLWFNRECRPSQSSQKKQRCSSSLRPKMYFEMMCQPTILIPFQGWIC